MYPLASYNKIPVLSFFSGAGFLDIGFHNAGFDLVFHNEYNPEFARGFKYGYSRVTNVPEPEVTVGDITRLTREMILEKAFGGHELPPTWGVIGGPPCPDFSVGGKNRGSEGENGILSLTYIKRIMELQPTFFLFENVPGLLKTEKHRLFLNALRERAEGQYLTDIKILNALEFGVPQDRGRVFFIGIQKGWLRDHGKMPSSVTTAKNWFPYPEPDYPNAKAIYPWPTRAPFRGNPVQPDVPSELTVAHWILDDSISNLVNQNEHFRAKSPKFSEIEEGAVQKKSFKRLHRYRYAPTSAYGNNEVHLHPTEARRLTVREALRLQSVPDEYALPPDMSLSNKFKTIANGVPVRLAEAVANSIYRFLTQ